jgi:imidazole glycerol phosphate synthase glutamine amidotransferase subunit
MITLIDYGAGNLHSMEGALDRLGFAHQRAERPDDVKEIGTLILPGVGHFGAARIALKERGWWSMLPQMVADGTPLLGVCLGLQLLAEGSGESPKDRGLALVPGIVRRLGPGVKVPLMGWAQVSQANPHPALPNPKENWLYFVHSYALETTSETVYTAHHGRTFAAVEARGRVIGFQPHPEKSGPYGLVLLRSVLSWMGESPRPSSETSCN